MWYVIQTQTGKEELIKKSIETVFPEDIYKYCKILYSQTKKKYLGEWHEARKNMFPGYIFLITDDINSVYQHLKFIPAFTKLLNYDKTIVPIAKEEEEFLQTISGDEGIVDMSYGIIEGDQIKVKGGALKGLESIIHKIDRHKRTALIEIELLGTIRSVEVGLEIISKVE